MAQRSMARVVGLADNDPLFARIRVEAEDAARNDPVLAAFLTRAVLNHETLESAVIDRVAERLDHPDAPSALIRQIYDDVVAARPGDRRGVPRRHHRGRRSRPRLPADDGAAALFQGLPRAADASLAHAMLRAGRRDFALYLQSRASSVFGVDINPAARIGKGIFLDHATGLVVGETTVIEDDVSILQGVTLGGTGKETGDRHPKIRHGVLIGAGAKILGNIEVGHCARVAAGSVVLAPVPHNKTVAGVPARIVGEAGCAEPARDMNQILAEKLIDPVRRRRKLAAGGHSWQSHARPRQRGRE